MREKKKPFLGFTLKELIIVIAIVGAIWLFLFFAVSDGPGPGRRMQCSNNLRQIGFALEMYHQAYGRYPPAYVCDAEGKPLYSWRVLILPYMDSEFKKLHEEFHLDEPWDSPHNITLLELCPYIYHCPEITRTGFGPWGETPYLIIVGENAVSTGPQSCSHDEITDGLYDTIIVLESSRTVPWSAPQDIGVDSVVSQVGNHKGVSLALFCDGSVRTVEVNADLGPYLKINDGEPEK